MKLQIISDGTSAGTQVLTTDGIQIEGVQLIQILLSADERENQVILELSSVPITVVANAQILPPEGPYEVEDLQWEPLLK